MQVRQLKNSPRQVRVLVVDDHNNMRHLWGVVLKSFGIPDIVEAEHAVQALEILKDSPVDVAIIDHILSDVSGAELISLIRRSPDSVNNTIPIIACTADTRRRVVYDLVNAGADEILTKPVSPNAVWQRLQSIFGRRRQFIRTPTYFGPDRRRLNDPNFKGPDRRDSGVLI